MRHKIHTFMLLGIFMLIVFPSASYAQYSSSNSFMRRAIVRYDKDTNGFYQKVENQQENFVTNAEKVYAFDKKASNLYVMTNCGNYEITLTKDYAKVVKKNKMIPQLKDDELDAAIKKINLALETRFANANEDHRRELEAARQRAIEDSIATVRRAQAERAALEKKKDDYKSVHDWQWLPTDNSYISCAAEGCEQSEYKDSLFALGVINDTIYYMTNEDLALDVQYAKLHYCPIPKKLQKNADFMYHCEVYKDSLIMHDFLTPRFCAMANYDYFDKALTEVKKLAPYGFVEDWSWDDEFSVSFKFSYRNLNKRTIKYIDVYWAIKNDVGDVRKTGHFSGTGPVEYLNGASWDWDHSYYYVAGDATKMNITKIIITYTNGTKQSLTGKMIKFN